MGDKDGKINYTNRALTAKWHRTHLKVVYEIRDQEECRACEGAQHAGAMCVTVLCSNEAVPGNKKNGASGIQHRINGRQLSQRNQRGKISGSNIKIKKTRRINGLSAITPKVVRSNLR